MSNKNTSCGYKKISEILTSRPAHVRFLGIGGVSMYSLARLCMERGIRISGYDRESNTYTESLRKMGVNVSYEADFMTASSATLVVYSLAIDSRDSELVYTGSLDIPHVSRADFLSYLIEDYKTSIAVSGSHGKSTVTSLIHSMLSLGGRSPTTAVGASISGGEPCSIGGKDVFIYESCEYGDSFLCMHQSILAITNIEHDHPDYFKDEGAVRDSFLRCINNTKDFAVLPIDDKNVRSIINDVKVPYVTYGSAETADYRYTIDDFLENGSRFSIYHGSNIYTFTIFEIGLHNVAHAVCAAVTALEYGIDGEVITEALLGFKLPKRRLEDIGTYSGRRVIYDYAHHPTEIAAAIGAVRTWYAETVTVIFKPHTYTRTRALWDGFVRALSLADYVILADIYPAREEPIFDITSERLAEQIGDKARYISNDGELIDALSATEGLIILMGAGELEAYKARILAEK